MIGRSTDHHIMELVIDFLHSLDDGWFSIFSDNCHFGYGLSRIIGLNHDSVHILTFYFLSSIFQFE